LKFKTLTILITCLYSLGLAGAYVAAAEASQQHHRAIFQQFSIGQKNVKVILAEQDFVWIGSSAGLIKYDPAKDDYQFYNNRNGLRANGVFSIDRLDDNHVAVGTYGGGLAVLDERTEDWRLYSIPDGIGDPFVYDVLRAKNGDIWIATWTGVNRVIGGDLENPEKWELHTVKSTKGGLPNDWVYGLAEGDNGVIWLATEGGLAKFEQGQWTNWNHAKGLGADYELIKKSEPTGRDPAAFSRHHAQQKKDQGLQGVSTAYNPNYVVSMAVDSNNRVWAGTWGAGLALLENGKITNLTKLDGLPSNQIFMLKLDKKDNVLWIGTSRGLARMNLDDQSLKIFGKQHGLYSDAVFSMDIAPDDTLWIGSFGGVSHIAKFPQ